MAFIELVDRPRVEEDDYLDDDEAVEVEENEEEER